MRKYGILAIFVLLAGCSPKQNPDTSWKADCARNFSQSNFDYVVCMKRKKEEAEKRLATEKTSAVDPNAISTSKVGYRIRPSDGVNIQRMDEEGASKIM